MLFYKVFLRLKNCFAVVKLRLGFCANIQRTRVAQSYATLSSSRSRTSRDSSSYDPQRRSISRIPITQMPIRSLPSRNLDSRAHLSSLGAGEQWRHYGYGPRHRILTGFSARQSWCYRDFHESYTYNGFVFRSSSRQTLFETRAIN